MPSGQETEWAYSTRVHPRIHTGGDLEKEMRTAGSEYRTIPLQTELPTC